MYLAMGMSADEYWNGDPAWAKAYREANKIRNERLNHEMWLQGLYIYDALCRVSPVLHAFAKGGTKPLEYPSEPYSLTQKEQEYKEQKKREKAMEDARKYMESYAIQWAADNRR